MELGLRNGEFEPMTMRQRLHQKFVRNRVFRKQQQMFNSDTRYAIVFKGRGIGAKHYVMATEDEMVKFIEEELSRQRQSTNMPSAKMETTEKCGWHQGYEGSFHCMYCCPHCMGGTNED